MDGVEITNSGLKFEGEWKEVCHFSGELEELMEEYLESKEEIEEFEEWRPHKDDSDAKMRDKTAEEAAVKKREIEKDFIGAKREFKVVEERMVDSVEDLRNGINPSRDLKEALREIEKVLGVESVRSVRKIEETIYKKMMLKLNPYYFDTEDFSVNLEMEDDDIYCLRINVSDESLREHFDEKFR